MTLYLKGKIMRHVKQLVNTLLRNYHKDKERNELSSDEKIDMIIKKTDALAKIVEYSCENDFYRNYTINDMYPAMESIKNADPNSRDITDRANDALEIITKGIFSIGERHWDIEPTKDLLKEEEDSEYSFWLEIMDYIHHGLLKLKEDINSAKNLFPRICDYEIEWELCDGRLARPNRFQKDIHPITGRPVR